MQARTLFCIIISQFFCTSLWFAGNAVMGDLALAFHLPATALGHLTSAVQLGFISGTLCFALFTISDRYSPSKVFFICSVLAALCNLGICLPNNSFAGLIAFRVLTGFFLAGIYPVGMKLAADHFEHGLGKSLGFLVGALVLGTSLPHFLKATGSQFPWRNILYATTTLSLLGGLIIWKFVPDGKYRKAGSQLDFKAFLKVFHQPNFRAAAFGYFGHMWELYAFWTFLPLALTTIQSANPDQLIHTSLLSFLIIGIGGPACATSGLISGKMSEKKIAIVALLCSGFCCLTSPLILSGSSAFVSIAFLLFWGIMVVADSPLFSTLAAKQTSPSSRGTALTIMNCIGFSITIISIQLLTMLHDKIPPAFIYLPLAPGPILGLIALRKKINSSV